ncbi:MAG: hypothetical protein U0Y82_11440 [Thermoleophilia bacterium]
MDLREITPQQKMLAGSGAMVLYALALLFFPWYSSSGVSIGGRTIGSSSVTGWDVVPSSWIVLILALLAAGALAAYAFDVDIPVNLPPLSVAAYCSSVVFLMTIAVLFEFSSGRSWGLYLAVLMAIIGLVAAVWVWRDRDAV